MKSSETKKRISSREKELSVLQVREYIDRYHPKMKGSDVVISPCGGFASVREVPKTDHH
jgi:hypothetical protein